jgi:hypothetical protein
MSSNCRRPLRFAVAAAMMGASGLAASNVPLHAASQPKWTALADCAAAYEANAKLADPDRPASMTAMISDVANDYAQAATKAYNQQAGKSGSGSVDLIKVHIAKQTTIFSKQPREKVEKVIDACPQIDN